ncbi:MAG: hypothetical protein P0Y55_11190 [Candidatus Cohnella colombiensis]|uniref:Signal transduction histidine kinase n=1 Tax=Candidatus Cohnella colombiensis TaxID=3121368 RepID=A0AA95ETH5_9BACL|nr:MAG: hypothetical protein P0Y55_11190 [Cohnella sp.]
MESNLIFIIASFGLAVVLILSREHIPQKLKRGMSIISIFLVAFAFFLIVYSLLNIGS